VVCRNSQGASAGDDSEYVPLPVASGRLSTATAVGGTGEEVFDARRIQGTDVRCQDAVTTEFPAFPELTHGFVLPLVLSMCLGYTLHYCFTRESMEEKQWMIL